MTTLASTGLSLQRGSLTSVKLRFQIRPEQGRALSVTCEIEPPSRTDLAQKKYADLIEKYLKEQGVKLR